MVYRLVIEKDHWLNQLKIEPIRKKSKTKLFHYSKSIENNLRFFFNIPYDDRQGKSDLSKAINICCSRFIFATWINQLFLEKSSTTDVCRIVFASGYFSDRRSKFMIGRWCYKPESCQCLKYIQQFSMTSSKMLKLIKNNIFQCTLQNSDSSTQKHILELFLCKILTNKNC